MFSMKTSFDESKNIKFNSSVTEQSHKTQLRKKNNLYWRYLPKEKWCERLCIIGGFVSEGSFWFLASTENHRSYHKIDEVNHNKEQQILKYLIN